MLLHNLKRIAGSASIVAMAATGASASTITAWNTANVDVGATPANDITGYSTVFDRPAGEAGAVTNGRIAFTPPEADSPGIKVVQQTYDGSGPQPRQELSGCLMTSSAATCDSPFQSGKRIKQEMTGLGPVDLVFDVTPGEGVDVYQVFGRLINATASTLVGATIELGFGIGDAFVRATGGEGLRFSPDFRGTPTSAAGSQFPFGLFGDAATNTNFDIGGFFDITSRAGLVIDYAETVLKSGAFFGSVADRFGGWLSNDQVPQAASWEYNSEVEALVMAWLTPDGVWELRRDFDGEGREIGNIVSLTDEMALRFDTFAGLQNYLGLGDALGLGELEDLANLNLNYAIELGANVGFDQFTLRTTVMPIPVPPAAPLLIGGLAMMGFLRRRRAQQPG